MIGLTVIGSDGADLRSITVRRKKQATSTLDSKLRPSLQEKKGWRPTLLGESNRPKQASKRGWTAVKSGRKTTSLRARVRLPPEVILVTIHFSGL